MPIKVVVNGAQGRMGWEVVKAVCREPDLEIVGAVELKAVSATLKLPDDSEIPLSPDLIGIITAVQPDVVVDFTTRDVAVQAARICLENGVNLVSGTTGLTDEEIGEIGRLAESNQVAAMIAPNFALGAVLMMHMAKIAARYFDHAEIIELHHNLKIDAPSGTAMMTARLMSEAKDGPFTRPGADETQDSRGEAIDGISIHSVRLPGLVAHQEVLLGGLGQTLSIRHDSISRESFMPGVVLAIREVIKRRGLVYGLDALLGL